jgi:hypothetical protein
MIRSVFIFVNVGSSDLQVSSLAMVIGPLHWFFDTLAQQLFLQQALLRQGLSGSGDGGAKKMVRPVSL